MRRVIDKFKELFLNDNLVLLCKQQENQTDDLGGEPLVEVPMEEKLGYVQYTILKIINVFVDALLTFYEMDDEVSLRDLQRELYVNLITNAVLEGQLYFLVINLINSTLETQMRRLSKIMYSKEL